MPSLSDPTLSLAQRLASMEAVMRKLTVPKPLNLFAIRNGAIPEFDSGDKLVARYGLQPDGSHGVVVLDGPTPPKPTRTWVSPTGTDAINVFWDGKSSTGAALPSDVVALEVWTAWSDPGNFTTPDESAWGFQGDMSPRGGYLVVPGNVDGGLTNVRCRLRSSCGKTGAWSTAYPATTSPTRDTTRLYRTFGSALAGKTATAGSPRSLFTLSGNLSSDGSNLVHLTASGTIDVAGAGQAGLAIRYATGAPGTTPSVSASSPLVHTEMLSFPAATTGARISLSVRFPFPVTGYGPWAITLLGQLVTIGTSATTRSSGELTDWSVVLTSGGVGTYVAGQTSATL